MPTSVTVENIPDDIDSHIMRYMADHKVEGITNKSKAIVAILKEHMEVKK